MAQAPPLLTASMPPATATVLATASAGTVLLSIPAAELHRVVVGDNNQQPQAVAQGAFTISAQQADGIVAAVGDYSWTLLPASHTMKVGQQTYMFQESLVQHATFLSVTLAADMDAEAGAMLEDILTTCTDFRESNTLLADPEAQAGDVALSESAAYKSSLARGVEGMSRRFATGVLASANYAAAGISRQAARLTPAEPTANPVAISPQVAKGLQQTEQAAGYAAKAVHGAVDGLAWMGAKAADGVLWMTGANKPSKPGSEAGRIKEVGKSSLLGFAEAWEAMETAGAVVLLSARDGMQSVVSQRYGPAAGEASVSGLNAAGHSVDAVYAARKVGAKTIVKTAVKKTASGQVKHWAGVEKKSGTNTGTPNAVVAPNTVAIQNTAAER